MQLRFVAEHWPVAGTFRISRSAVTSVSTLLVEVEEGGFKGRGEACPEAHFGQTMELAFHQLGGLGGDVGDREALAELLPAGAARNALDAALWDLDAKSTGVPAWKTAGLPALEPVVTAYTLSVDTPDAMARQAARYAHRDLLKVKVGGGDDVARIEAVRGAAPRSRLILDANEAWDFDKLRTLAPRMKELGVELIEQPLPAGADRELEGFESPVPLCADESCLDRSSLPAVVGRYDFINIKLDKTGGLTEALRLAEAAVECGLRLMVGCMLGTSLAMAPATLVAQRCEFVDLDGPLLLAEDRQPGLVYAGSSIEPVTAAVWG